MQKYIIAGLAFLAISLQASTPVDDITRGTPLVVKETGGGFVPPEYAGWGEKISIYPNGRVIETYRANGSSPWQHQLLAVLSTEVLNKISAIVQSIQPGQLTFPDEPECTDAPVTTYSAKNSSGQLVEFAQIMACRLGVLEDFYDAYKLQSILDGLDALGSN